VNLAARLGLQDPPGLSVDRRPAILLHGDSAGVERAWPAVDTALRRRVDYRLVVGVPAAEFERVQRLFSHEHVVALPSGAVRRISSWRRRLGLVLAIDAGMTHAAIADAIGNLPERPERGGGLADGVSRLILSATGFRPLETIGDVRRALGSPRTILCLGNGPTSEDPALDAHADAALFRVNWTWRGRGRWTRPDAVFTADPDLPPEDLRPVLVFPDASTGRRILMQHLLARRGSRRGHAFADALLPPPGDPQTMDTPTNGALMIAVAAALEPETLVVAGLDLYRHPAGRYPGSEAVEGYARGHSGPCDLAVIGRALDAFSGRVVLLSPNLAEALNR
jgi:hypothetical protein